MPKLAKMAAGLAIVTTLGLGGCHYHGPYRHGPVVAGGGVVYVQTRPPPPPRYVPPPPRPTPLAIWIAGYWNWTGVQFVWVDGRWDPSPPRYKVWAPDQWIHTDRGWYRQPGRWVDDRPGRGR